MSWHYSQALEAAYSEVKSSGGAACAQSKSTTMLAACSWPDKMTDHFQPSLFGTTCELLTVGRGMDWWTSSLAVSRAKTSALPAPVWASMETEAACGAKCAESWAKWDRASCSWKTRRPSLTAALTKSSRPWPRWGMMRAGECWAQSMPALHIEESESGFWPTPLHSEARQGLQIRRPGKKGSQVSLTTAVRIFPTPTVNGNYNRKGLTHKSGDGLATAVRMYPPPTAQDASNNGGPAQAERNMVPLNAVIGGPLNPAWVEWLMGWPVGWTACVALATDKFQQWRRSHGES